jgi:hypothetical protein
MQGQASLLQEERPARRERTPPEDAPGSPRRARRTCQYSPRPPGRLPLRLVPPKPMIRRRARGIRLIRLATFFAPAGAPHARGLGANAQGDPRGPPPPRHGAEHAPAAQKAQSLA